MTDKLHQKDTELHKEELAETEIAVTAVVERKKPDQQRSKKYSAEEIKQLEDKEAAAGKNEIIDLNEIKLSKSDLPKENNDKLNKENPPLNKIPGTIVLEDLMSRRAMPDMELPFLKQNSVQSEIRHNQEQQKTPAMQNLLSPQYYYQAFKNMLSSQDSSHNEIISTIRNTEKSFTSDRQILSRSQSVQREAKSFIDAVSDKTNVPAHVKAVNELTPVRQQASAKDIMPTEFKNSTPLRSNTNQRQTGEMQHAAQLLSQNKLNQPLSSPVSDAAQKLTSIIRAVAEPVARIAAKIRLSAPKTEQPVKDSEIRNSSKRPDTKQTTVVSEPAITRITRELAELVKKNVPSAARIPAEQILTVIKSSPEVKALGQKFESLSKENSVRLIQQMQTPMSEIFRMVSAKQSVPLTANMQHNIPPHQSKKPADEIKAVVAETISRIGSLYGGSFPAPSRQKENHAERNTSADKERNIKSEIFKNQKPRSDKPPPPVIPPQLPPAAGAFHHSNTPAQAIPLKTIHGDKSSKAELDKEAEKLEKERIESEERLENRRQSELEELLRNEKNRRLKEEKILKILKVHTISGRVLDEKSGKGIPGVFVNAGELGSTVTDSGGEFSFYNVPNAKIYSLNVTKNGYRFNPSSITDTADAPNRHFFYGNKKV